MLITERIIKNADSIVNSKQTNIQNFYFLSGIQKAFVLMILKVFNTRNFQTNL